MRSKATWSTWAVGIIIGAAFGTVVKSVVADILMPIVASVFGTPDFGNLFAVLRNPTGEVFTSIEAAREAGAAVLGYGLFINALIAFSIVAFVLFLVVKSMNRLKKQEEEAPAPPPVPSAEERILTESRDLLAKRA